VARVQFPFSRDCQDTGSNLRAIYFADSCIHICRGSSSIVSSALGTCIYVSTRIVRPLCQCMGLAFQIVVVLTHI
jgi:hypothetical protein